MSLQQRTDIDMDQQQSIVRQRERDRLTDRLYRYERSTALTPDDAAHQLKMLVVEARRYQSTPQYFAQRHHPMHYPLLSVPATIDVLQDVDVLIHTVVPGTLPAPTPGPEIIDEIDGTAATAAATASPVLVPSTGFPTPAQPSRQHLDPRLYQHTVLELASLHLFS